MGNQSKVAAVRMFADLLVEGRSIEDAAGYVSAHYGVFDGGPEVTSMESATPINQSTAEGLTVERMSSLGEWWIGLAGDEATRTVPKAIEYGSADLLGIGEKLARLTSKQDWETPDLLELGCYFYMIGKIERWTAALEDGRAVSDDTIFDIKVYATMVQRIRETGGWPGV